ncbi:VanZ family protein [Caldibacillus lycopersici]|uniref:VanZ family protein n=1 Tax=Perspicuibacillus lycopersici TaxID=1325689 RepID=A0AAE3LMQ5_9BACI|nr:VanZ family protein [Perspicuibacillus lycopersici]MCU9613166.1 VanZ family protein [Perspicuibacillus lycopersici]
MAESEWQVMRFHQKFWIWLVRTIAIMLVMFTFSNMSYDKQDIKPFLQEKVKITETTLPTVEFHYNDHQITTQDPYAFLEFLLRKSAHILEYFILTVFWFKTLSYVPYYKGIGIKYIVPAIFSLGYAALDEWHQTFVSGRTGQLIDVFVVDAIGVVLACIVAGVLPLIDFKKTK